MQAACACHLRVPPACRARASCPPTKQSWPGHACYHPALTHALCSAVLCCAALQTLSHVPSPVSGTVLEVNTELERQPQLVRTPKSPLARAHNRSQPPHGCGSLASCYLDMKQAARLAMLPLRGRAPVHQQLSRECSGRQRVAGLGLGLWRQCHLRPGGGGVESRGTAYVRTAYFTCAAHVRTAHAHWQAVHILPGMRESAAA